MGIKTIPILSIPHYLLFTYKYVSTRKKYLQRLVKNCLDVKYLQRKKYIITIIIINKQFTIVAHLYIINVVFFINTI